MAKTGAAVERPTRVRHWVVVFAASLAVITYMDRVSISFAAPFMRHDLGLTEVQMGWIFAAFGWAYAMFEIPGGFLGDWIGPRRVLIRVVLWWSFFTAATGWAWSFVSLTVTRFFFGAGEAGCFPNLAKAFTTWLPENERVRAQGILWLSARWGGAFTPLLVAAIMRAVGWRHGFEIFGSVGVVWAVLFYLWYRDNPLDNPKLNGAERELLKHSSEMASGHGDVPWTRMAGSLQVWMLCGQYFCLNYGWYFYVTWLPSYLREARHLTIGNSAWLSVLPLLCGGLGNPASVMLSRLVVRKTGDVVLARRLMAYLGCAGACGFLVLSTTVNDPLLAMLAIGMASFSNDLVMPGAWATVMDVGGKYAGTLSGTMNMCGNIGGALSPLAIGYMLSLSHNNWNLTFYISAAVYSMGILFWALLDPVTPLDSPAERTAMPVAG
ncbi:MAG TPA: MFS transporter [Bryobacteraceae bacterium]|jgi:MFS family permease